jgi:16S rRNA (guanine527-N7)-methyltransferase
MTDLQPLEPTQAFLESAAAFAITFDPGDIERMGLFLAMLLETNKKFNLTAITDPADAWQKHIFDSLTLMPWIGAAAPRRIADIGSGGGLPGLPLAIAFPAIEFALIEATGKKAGFLREAVATLALANVTVINDRAETIGRDETHRARYDIVLARAIGRLAVVAELAVPLACVGGRVLAIKGGRAGGEVAEAKRALHLLHSRVVETVTTPTGTVVIIEKARTTPKAYPRKPGEPKMTPL